VTQIFSQTFSGGSIVPGLQESLHQILRVDGARTAALIDVSTGTVIGSAGEEHAGLAAAATSLADEVRLAATSPGQAGAGLDGAGTLEEVMLVTGNRLHLVRILDQRPDEHLALFVDLDRARTNIALAAWQVAQAGPAVLA
jgi:hypothetical protein